MIPVNEPLFISEEKKYLAKCIDSGWVSSEGPFVKEFEEKFSSFVGKKYGVAVSNGTAALEIAVGALDIKPGDEVILPTFTIVSCLNAILTYGAKPVFVDSESETWNMDADKIEEKITKKTKAIMVVHMYGHPCDMEKIMKIAKKHKLLVIEDAAEAHGSTYKGKKAGSFGDISCFSFYGNKTITTGEGGMCLTDSKELNDKMRFLRDHGMKAEKKYWHEVVGFNYRMTNMQAALGCAQLERLNSFLKIKKKNAILYEKLLKNVPWISFQTIKKEMKSNYWMFSILVNEKSKHNQDEIIKILKEKGIDTRNVFHAASNMPVHKKHFNKKELFKNSDYISKRALSLPSSTKLTQSDIRYIANIIKSI